MRSGMCFFLALDNAWKNPTPFCAVNPVLSESGLPRMGIKVPGSNGTTLSPNPCHFLLTLRLQLRVEYLTRLRQIFLVVGSSFDRTRLHPAISSACTRPCGAAAVRLYVEHRWCQIGVRTSLKFRPAKSEFVLV